MKKTFWNKLTARSTRGKTRCAAAVLALAMTFSMGAPLALAAQPEESTAAVTETVSAQQETAMPTLQTETPELAAQDPEAPPVQATEAEENSTNQHTPENSVVLTPEEIVSSSQYSFSIHPRASPRQLPHTAKRSSEKLPPRYQKMLQNRYVSARKNIAQSQKLQIFPAKSAFCLVVLTCVWYYT